MGTIIGTIFSETLNGTVGDDCIEGLGGNDTLNGLGGNDIFIGGDGNDILNGAGGDDRYEFSTGWGSDTLNDTGGADTIFIDATIVEADIAFFRIAGTNNLLVREYNGAGNVVSTVTITDFYLSPANQVETLEFDSGATIDLTGGLTFRQAANGSSGMTGSEGNDTIIDANFSVTINGLGGDDTIFANGGNDDIFAGDGDNDVDVGAGVDEVFSGAGDDTVRFYSGVGTSNSVTDTGGVDRIVVGAAVAEADVAFFRTVGTDELRARIFDGSGAVTDEIRIIDNYAGTGGFETLEFDGGSTIDLTAGLTFRQAANGSSGMTGSDGNDVIIDQNFAVTINGLGGDDTIFANGGNDDIFAGDGDNDVDVGAGVDEVFSGAGDDTVRFYNGVGASNTVTDTDGVDRIVVGAAVAEADVAFFRTTGTDELRARIFNGSGAVTDEIRIIDNYAGTGGFETLEFDGGSTIDLTAGLTFRQAANGSSGMTGSEGNDVIIDQNFAVTINGLGGDDTIFANGGNDDIFAGDGDNDVDVGAGFDEVFSGAGDDTVRFYNGVGASNTVTDTGGVDRIVVGAAVAEADVAFFRTAGTDELRARIFDGSGAVTDEIRIIDNYAGTGGFETLEFDGGSTIDLTAGLTFRQAANGSSGMTGSEGNDVIIDQNFSVTINGLGGDDTIFANGGNDDIFGGDGDDLFIAGLGSDEYFGGSGVDTVSYAEIGGAATVDLNNVGGFQATGAAGSEAFTGVENLVGSDFNDTFTGDAGDNVLEGGRGRDRLIGNDGDDTLIGGLKTDRLFGDKGRDTLIGDGGDDRLKGGAQNDTLIGGAGDDILKGGNGADDFVFDNKAGDNVIQDFNLTKDDIDLSGNSLLGDFADVLANSIDDVGGALITLSGGSSVLVENILVADLTADNFIF